MKEAILDLQCRSMHDNLIFSGIPEQTQDKPEETIFMHSALKIPKETIEKFTFHHVHCLGQKTSS